MTWLNDSVLIEPFANNEFLRLSLVAGILVAFTCAIAGTFVVLRGLAFIGDALSHGVLPGIATAMLLGVSGVIGAAVGSLVMMAGVSVVSRRFRLSGDTAIGLLFVGMLALGVMITSRSRTFVGDLSRILFGELLGVNAGDLILQFVALIIVAVVAFIARRPFLLLCVDEGLAKTSGFSNRLFHNLMLMIVAITVIASFQTVGTLLVLGMLIAPAATGALFARRISTVML
ncbi:MAG: metal ABC transporter permease, partial [Acidimicrobiaceae bacterium]